MNFKKTLVALAMASFASGAMASDVQIDTQDVWTLSAEGIQAGEVEHFADGTVLDFYLDSEIPASGTVSIKFDAGFDMSTVASETNTIDNSVNGVGTLKGTQSLQINYGSASFTFVSYTWDKDTQTLVLKLGNGQPLLGGASFGLEKFNAADAMVDVASVTVTSAKFDGSQIEDPFTAVLSQTATQFVITASQDMAGTVDAIDRDLFVANETGTSTVDINSYGQITVVDMSSEMKAATRINQMNVDLLGNFSQEADANAAWAGDFTLSGAAAEADQTTSKFEFEIDTPAGTSAGLAHTFAYDTATNGADDAGEYLVTPFQVAAELEISGIDEPVSYLAQQGFGSWDLEGGVINVPYLPVGFSGLSANVEISNESTEDATIYVEAFNQEGEYFARTPLTQVAAGQTVTKVSAQDLINAFGLTGKNKLSVTFSFDTEGNPDDITLAPYYRQNESRINVLSDEYKGK